MKIKLFIVAVVIVILLSFTQYNTPYSGKYYVGSTNEELILYRNNTFDINICKYKNNTTISGTYKISNNHIELIANDKNKLFFIKDIHSGEITGSVITFSKSQNQLATVFTKL